MHVASPTDLVTSHLADLPSAGRLTQRNRILLAYQIVGHSMTEEEAADVAGVEPSSSWRTRCSELRDLGFITYIPNVDGTPRTVYGSQGRPVHICVITGPGISYLRQEGLLAE